MGDIKRAGGRKGLIFSGDSNDRRAGEGVVEADKGDRV